MLALAVIGWVGYARLVRGQVLRAREFEYVVAARALGAGTLRILTRHVLPTALPPVTGAGDARHGRRDSVGSRAEFSRPRRAAADAELGDDDQRRARALLDAPHLTVFPGLFLALVVLGFNFVGDGLRDAHSIRVES